MPAHYVLPQFNLTVNIWRGGAAYTDPPDVVTVGNLALGRRVAGSKLQDGSTSPSDGGMWLLLPKDTDIRDSKAASGEDMVEVPAGSGRLYTSKWVDDIGKGFSNEHRFSVIFGLPPWGVPFPGPPLPPPPPPSSLPYSKVVNYPQSPDAVSWTPSGKTVAVFVFVATFNGAIPVVTSALSGALTPLTGQGPVSYMTGWSGYVWEYQYSPPPGAETLSVSLADSLGAYAWAVIDSGAAGNDDEGGVNWVSVTATNFYIVCSGSPGDAAYSGLIGQPGCTPLVVSGDLSDLGLFPGALLIDANSDAWLINLIGVSFFATGNAFVSYDFDPFSSQSFAYVFQSIPD